MNKLIVIALATITGVMLWLAVQGVSFKSKKFIKPTTNSNPQQLGRAIFRRLYPELKENKTFFWGVESDDNFSISTLRSVIKSAKKRNLSFNKINLDQYILNPKSHGHVVVGKTRDLSHMIDGNWINQWEKEKNKKLFSIYFVRVPFSSIGRHSKYGVCSKEGKGSLSCIIDSSSRRIFRKIKFLDRVWVAGDQPGAKDYLVYLVLPR